ncbi:MAG: energy transducer TonB, partial [candidate division NC10 bacterium]
PAPPPPLGQTTGSVSGTGALTLDVSDFPHAWYLRQVLQKVEERWQKQGQTSEPSQKPLVLVEIQRDGSIRAPKIEKSSGNAFYDQAALRAIADASPFPPLPQEWSKPSLRVLFRFELRPERG